MPRFIILPFLAFAYAAYEAPTASLTNLYAAAAVTTAGIVPWTLLAMMKTNHTLMARAETVTEKSGKSEEQDLKEVKALLKKWTRLNAARAVFPLVGAALGIWGVLSI